MKNLRAQIRQQIIEETNPDIGFGKWKKVKGSVLQKYKDEVLALIQNAYKDIGGHPNYKSASDISTADAQAWELINLDDDPDIDAVNIAKKKKAGTKFVGLGHDGSKAAKSSVIKRKIDLLKKNGYYVEVSGRIFDILKSAGINIIDDERVVRSVLAGKDIKWNNDGTYSRKIGGKTHTKAMMGRPKT
jgi:hypothetical protein